MNENLALLRVTKRGMGSEVAVLVRNIAYIEEDEIGMRIRMVGGDWVYTEEPMAALFTEFSASPEGEDDAKEKN